jgi:hypothetical protein
MTDNPDAKFAEAEAWLRARNISFRRVSRYQLKIGTKVSFYPGKQTVFVDREDGARPQTGLAGLAAALIEFGIMARPAPQLVCPAKPELKPVYLTVPI